MCQSDVTMLVEMGPKEKNIVMYKKWMSNKEYSMWRCITNNDWKDDSSDYLYNHSIMKIEAMFTLPTPLNIIKANTLSISIAEILGPWIMDRFDVYQSQWWILIRPEPWQATRTYVECSQW